MQIIQHRRNTINLVKSTLNKYGIEVDIRSLGYDLIVQHEPYLPGVKFSMGVEKAGKLKTQSWHFPDGVKQYFKATVELNEQVSEPFFGERYVSNGEQRDLNFSQGEGLLWAISWSNEGEILGESYVNMIPTRLGGTHVAGFRDGIYAAIKKFIDLALVNPRFKFQKK